MNADTNYTPKVPTPAMVDRAIEQLRNQHPGALDRPDFIVGMLAAFAAIGQNVSHFAATNPLPRTNPLVASVVMSLSHNLGDNFELYRAVRDTLYPLDDIELPS